MTPALGKMNRIRVMFVTPFRPEQAGEARYASEYALHMSRGFSDQIELVVLTKKGNGFNSLRAFVADLLPRGRLLSTFATFLYMIKSYFIYRPDVVHVTYGPNPYYGGRIGEPLILFLAFAKLRRIPTLITMHSMWLPQDIEERHKRTRFRKIASIADLKRIYIGLVYGLVVSLSDKVLLLTSASAARHSEIFRASYALSANKLGEEIHGLSIINTGNGTKSGPKVVMSFGFFRQDKGYHVLIRAFPRVVARFRSSKLLLVGRPETRDDERYVAELIKETEELRLCSNVRFVVGFVDDSELQIYLNSASVFVFPYLRNIGASGSVHQAIGFLKPIVVTKIGYNTEIDFALQVPRNDVEALSEAILKALTMRDWKKSELGRRQERYAQCHSWKVVAESNCVIYQDLVRCKGRRL